MQEIFPAVGHCYLVDFEGDGGEFRVQLDFHSETSLTYTGVKPDGTLDNSDSETVAITVEPIRDQLFLVTWEEREGDTVVHLEHYKNNMIITNITEPGPDLTHPTFSKFHGTMKQTAQHRPFLRGMVFPDKEPSDGAASTLEFGSREGLSRRSFAT